MYGHFKIETINVSPQVGMSTCITMGRTSGSKAVFLLSFPSLCPVQRLAYGKDKYAPYAASAAKYLTQLNASNCFNKMMAYWRIEMGSPMDTTVPNMLRTMVRTGKYTPDPKWIMQARIPCPASAGSSPARSDSSPECFSGSARREEALLRL